TWEVRKTLEGHKDRVHCAVFSRDGKQLITTSFDGTVFLWDTATGKQLRSLKGHDGPVYQAAFAPDGKTVATAGEDRTARVWDVARGAEVQQVTHDMPVYSVLFTPDAKTLVVGGGINDPVRRGGGGGTSQGELKLWDPATGKQKAVIVAPHGN